jgi:hypothetical protein
VSLSQERDKPRSPPEPFFADLLTEMNPRLASLGLAANNERDRRFSCFGTPGYLALEAPLALLFLLAVPLSPAHEQEA